MAAQMADTKLAQLLASLSLDKFTETFTKEDIDYEVAKGMSLEELAELGLTIGARKKLYAALHESPESGNPPAAIGGTAYAAWPMKVGSANQFQWRFQGQKYPESKETRSDGLWCPETPDFKTNLVTCQEIGKFTVWDREEAKITCTLEAKRAQGLAGVKAGDRELLATAGDYNGTVISLFDVLDGKELVCFEKIAGESFYVMSMSFLPTNSSNDVNLLVIGNDLNSEGFSTVRKFDMGTGQLSSTMPMPFKNGGYVRADVLNPGMFFAVSRGPDGKVHLFDARAGAVGPVKTLFGGASSEWVVPTFNPLVVAGASGQRLVSLFHQDQLTAWDVGTGKIIADFASGGKCDLQFKGGGVTDTAIVSCRRDGKAHVWMHSGGAVEKDKAADFTLPCEPIQSNAPVAYSFGMNGQSMFLGCTNGIYEGYWGEAPKRAW